MIPIISIVGKSNSGKTTLIQKLLPVFSIRKIKVGTIKHDAHTFEIDYPGKDTYKHFHSGANRVLIASKQKFALIQRLDAPITLREFTKRYFNDVDLVLTEGYKSEQMPKIEVFRADIHEKPLCNLSDNLIAFVSETNLIEKVSHFLPDESEAIVDFIIQNFITEAK